MVTRAKCTGRGTHTGNRRLVIAIMNPRRQKRRSGFKISSQSTWQIAIIKDTHVVPSLENQSRNRDNGDRVLDDSDRSFVSIHPSWHLDERTLDKISALVLHDPADQPVGEVC